MPEITWIQNRQNIIQLSTNFRPTVTSDGKATLYIDKVRPEDAGEYTIRASNSEGSVEQTARLSVQCERPMKYYFLYKPISQIIMNILG